MQHHLRLHGQRGLALRGARGGGGGLRLWKGAASRSRLRGAVLRRLHLLPGSRQPRRVDRPRQPRRQPRRLPRRRRGSRGGRRRGAGHGDGGLGAGARRGEPGVGIMGQDDAIHLRGQLEAGKVRAVPASAASPPIRAHLPCRATQCSAGSAKRMWCVLRCRRTMHMMLFPSFPHAPPSQPCRQAAAHPPHTPPQGLGASACPWRWRHEGSPPRPGGTRTAPRSAVQAVQGMQGGAGRQAWHQQPGGRWGEGAPGVPASAAAQHGTQWTHHERIHALDLQEAAGQRTLQYKHRIRHVSGGRAAQGGAALVRRPASSV